jgi:sn-glycerol 3-phosphate transport system permease protein
MPIVPGPHGLDTYRTILLQGLQGTYLSPPVWQMMWNSLLMALIITAGKIALSLLSAYAIVFFQFPGRMLAFWLIFLTLMLPVEVRIMPTYEVVSDLGLINSMTGLTLPLIASATGTLLFRQFFLTIPDELVEAARIDGAGPLRFFKDVVLPLSATNIAALSVILFIYGWNQYLWPLLITTDNRLDTIVVGITKMIGTGDATTDWPQVMGTTLLAVLPPALVVVLMRRWFVKGLVDSEK